MWVAVCCSVVRCVAVRMLAHSKSTLCGVVLQRVAACCSVLQRVAACCSVLQRVAVSDNVQISTQQIHRVLTLNVLVTDVILSDCMKLQHSQPQHTVAHRNTLQRPKTWLYRERSVFTAPSLFAAPSPQSKLNFRNNIHPQQCVLS